MSHSEFRECADQLPRPPAPASAWDYWKFRLPIPLLFAGMLSLCIISPESIEQLLLGWIYFPIRVIPQVTIDGPAVILGLVSLVAWVMGLAGALKWFSHSRTLTTTNGEMSAGKRLRIATLATVGLAAR